MSHGDFRILTLMWKAILKGNVVAGCCGPGAYVFSSACSDGWITLRRYN